MVLLRELRVPDAVPSDAVDGRRAPGPAVAPDVVVWQADGRPLPATGYGDPIAQRLRGLGARVETVDYRTRALTAAERAAPVHVLSGGSTSAFADDPTTRRALDELRDVAQRAWSDEATLVGICLGAQLLARVIAPMLERRTPVRGMEAGWQTVAGPQGEVRGRGVPLRGDPSGPGVTRRRDRHSRQ